MTPYWPFTTPEARAEYDALMASGYAQLSEAHGLFMEAIRVADRAEPTNGSK